MDPAGKIMANRSPAPAGGVATMNQEELAKIQDGTAVVVRVEGTLSRRTVAVRGPVKAGAFRSSADDGECI